MHLLFLERIDHCFKKKEKKGKEKAASSVNCLPPDESRLGETLPLAQNLRSKLMSFVITVPLSNYHTGQFMD